MTRPAIIAIDPGASETGLVVRHGDDLLYHEVITRRQYGNLYAASVEGAVRFLRQQVPPPIPRVLIAIEDVQEPNPHLGLTNPRGALGTAKLVGALQAAFPDAVMVPSGGHGSGPLQGYPEPLRPTRGKGAGKDRLRHCRSAWDLSFAAETLLRQGATTKGEARCPN